MLSPKILFFSLSLSFFIFLESLNCNFLILNTVSALYFTYLLFDLTKKELFWGGFFTAILWFWWLGYSFIYYDLSYLIPFVLIGVGIVYGMIFYFGGLFDHILFRVIYFFLLSYVEILGFNWFKIELPFINSYLGTSKAEFLSILIVTAFFTYFIKKGSFKKGAYIYCVGILALFFVNQNSIKKIGEPQLGIEIVSTNIDQDKKWKKDTALGSIAEYLKRIDQAISDKKDLIIFPETAFPTVLNKDPDLFKELMERSNHIAIITGSLYEKEGLYYNSTYLFYKNEMKSAHKVVLVPFGEAVPFPEKIRDWINNTFYNGAKDYEVAKEPTTFEIEGIKFRNAICYEATTDDIYRNLDTNYVVATSNNAWFTPSTQPALQRLLLKYYAKKYDLLIYNVTNKSRSGIITQ